MRRSGERGTATWLTDSGSHAAQCAALIAPYAGFAGRKDEAAFKLKTPRVLSLSGRGTAEAIRPRYLPNPLTIQMIRSQSVAGRYCLSGLARDHLLSKLPDSKCSKYRAIEKRLEQIISMFFIPANVALNERSGCGRRVSRCLIYAE